MNLTKTIAAIATPIGRGGVGIIRLSGPKAHTIACKLTGKKAFTPRLATFCRFYGASHSEEQPQILDEGIVLYFKAPHSFTGEDVIELQGHGGMILQNQLLARVLALGATQAQAGEFSYRAFENDKLDLLQAEAIADAIDATSVAAANSAIRSLSGAFSKRINDVLQPLIEVRLYVEAAIDFPDEEDVHFLADGIIENKIVTLIGNVDKVLETAQQGQLLRDGVQVVIAGRPNAGKSSLLNTLAGQERAIVTAIEGTTRDTLQETIVLNGLTIHLTDTAGLRETDNVVEKMGITRAHSAIKQADLLLLVYDLSQDNDPLKLADTLLTLPIDSQPDDAHSTTTTNVFRDIAPSKVLFVGNKRDLMSQLQPDKQSIEAYQQVNVSCTTEQGIDTLIATLSDKVGFHPPENSLIARTRHIDALNRTRQHLQDALVQLVEFQAGELVAESLRQAQLSLSEITGEFNSDDLLGKIFGSFCIGK